MKHKEKPIIATTLSGLFVKHEPWDKAYILWYENMAKKLNDNSVKQWIDRPDYFKGVDEVMKRLYPKLSDEDRTTKARELFFDSVVSYIKQNKDVNNKEISDYFKSLKTKYRIALITTNTEDAVSRILSVTYLDDLFDIIECSLPEEKDDKRIVFSRFIEKYGKPLIYIGGGRKDSYDYCAEHDIPRVFANLEGEKDIPGVRSIYTLNELEKRIERL
ncbi:hypothetical protein J4466_04925 [Candidatus Pacearchaeota archaeon]|nr:hypothetical protein [Candidatus Pacearchaeota archaeon]